MLTIYAHQERTQVFQWSLEKLSVDKLKKQGYVIAVSDPCLKVSFLSS